MGTKRTCVGESVGKKIRKAEQDWVPYVAVVGDDEIKSETVSVRMRGGDEKTLAPLDLLDEVCENVEGMPTCERYTPLLLSEKPQFV